MIVLLFYSFYLIGLNFYHYLLEDFFFIVLEGQRAAAPGTKHLFSPAY